MEITTDPEMLGIAQTSTGPRLRVASATASAIELVLLAIDGERAARIERTVALEREGDEATTFSVVEPALTPGRRYALRASGPDAPRNRFDPSLLLLDPMARGIEEREIDGSPVWVSCVVDDAFDWGEVAKPLRSRDDTVIYEAHVRGLTMQAPEVPAELRGTYAGLAHESTVAMLHSLGITAVELLPVHAFATEEWLRRQGRTNYWGYNTLSYFAVHPAYASPAARASGPDAVLREFKGMVKHLHQAGIEVFLDVVYNHTAEEGIGGPTTSFRGLDNATWYRQDAQGRYIDVTGCGNSVDTSREVVQNLILDSLRYFANECQIDGFRFDLAVELGRDADCVFDPTHPLLEDIVGDPELQDAKVIAEPWDVGLGGWQTGAFPADWSEWNDRYRDRMRDFWMRDIAAARFSGVATSGIGRFATRFAGSSSTFSAIRGPLASVNFITAHDGFTMRDLVTYNVKHNLLNGENNRDGTNNNNSYNFGHEGPSADDGIERVRRRTMRNLMATLLFSAGMPMITAGDEYGRTQRGNNNAYADDSPRVWLDWHREPWQRDFTATVQRLVQLRASCAALRPSRYSGAHESVVDSSDMEWFDGLGRTMSIDEWNSPASRTLQYSAKRVRPAGEPSREGDAVLVLIHASEDDTIVTLPVIDGVSAYDLVWDSADETPLQPGQVPRAAAPGALQHVTGCSMRLYLVR